MSILLGLVGSLLPLLFWVALLLLPLVTLRATLSALRFWKQQEYLAKGMDSSLFELRIPPDLARTPRAMEQVLVAMHGLRNAPRSWRDFYLEGQVTRWFSFEMVSVGGMLRFFVRTPSALKNLVESAFFSYYPEVEVLPVADYAADLPATVFELEERALDLWGMELAASRDPVIPFKTYQAFSSGERDGIDPLSSLIEVLGKVQKGDVAIVQVVAAPADKNWNRGGAEAIAKIKETGALTPGETTSVKEIEDNVGKQAFSVLIRAGYIAPREGFSSSFVSSGIGNALNQLSSPKHNSFSSTLKTDGGRDTKARMLWALRRRAIPQDQRIGRWFTSVGRYRNVEERWAPVSVETLATLFHPLTSSVLTAPHLERLSSKRVSAPAGLEIYGDDEAIKKFL